MCPVLLAFTPLLRVRVVAVVPLVRTHKVQGPLHVWPVTLVHTLSRLGPPVARASIILLLELQPASRVQEALGLLLRLQAPALHCNWTRLIRLGPGAAEHGRR